MFQCSTNLCGLLFVDPEKSLLARSFTPLRAVRQNHQNHWNIGINGIK